MKVKEKRDQVTLPQSLAVIAAALVGLYFIGFFDPVPDRAPNKGSTFLYYGRDGETLAARDVSQDVSDAAEAALEDADYFGAYAIGPGGRTGVWVGARTTELARIYALAQCGDGCGVAAERVPLHRDPARGELVLTHAMATNLGIEWPYNNDVLAIGGANAWGYSAKASGKGGGRAAMRKAAEDCELRRATEAMSDTAISSPCLVATLDEILDLRPKPQLYPAKFTLDLTDIAPASETVIVESPNPPSSGFIPPYLPPRIYGARAAISSTTQEVVREAGWPLAGQTIALLKCNAGRRPNEELCEITHQRLPETVSSNGVLLVSPDLYAAFLAWQDTAGAGAFAISPYGAWGTSFNMQSKDAALQKAADWCWYYTRKNWEYRQVDKAFLDAGLDCRIIAVREQ